MIQCFISLHMYVCVCVSVYTFWCINPLSYDGLLWCYHFFLKSILSDIRITMPPFFLFSFLSNTFTYPLTLSLCVSLKLKWVSCRQHILGSFFFKHQCLFIGEPTLFAFRLGIDYKSWLLPSEWLLSGCFLSPLIPFPFVSAYFCKLVAFHRGIVSPFYIPCIYSRFLMWLPWSLH